MKKVISLIVCAVVIFSCFVLPVSAEGDGVIKVGRISAKAGDSITVPVSYVGNPGLYAIIFSVSYNKDIVEYVDYTSSSKSFNYTVHNEGEKVNVVMDARELSNVEGDLVLIKLNFKLKADAPAGRVLFPVYYGEDDVVALDDQGSELSVLSLKPETSAGAVTVLCSKHKFDIENADGKQCSVCGAVELNDGKIKVEDDAGIPEIDITSSNPTLPEPEVIDDSESDKEKPFNIGHLIPVFVAVAIAILLPVIFTLTRKNKKTDETNN